MLSCWNEAPTNRPTFTDLVTQLDSMIERDSDYMEISPISQSSDIDPTTIASPTGSIVHG